MIFDLYKRHTPDCYLLKIGRPESLKCNCPIWVYAYINGRTIRRSLHTRSWSAARNRLMLLEQDPEQPLTKPFNYTLARLIKQFLADAGGRNLRPSTLKLYRIALYRFAKYVRENRIDFMHITLKDLEQYRDSMQCATNTKRKEIQILRLFWKYLVDHEYVKVNLAQKLKQPKAEESVTMPYSDDDLRRLFEGCKQKKLRALMMLMLHTGLRISDACQLKKSDILTGRLVLRIEKTGVPISVMIPQPVLYALSECPNGKDGYLFWDGRKSIETQAQIWYKAIRRLGEKVGVKNARPHRFRDTFAVRLLQAGVSIYAVQKLLGHQSVRTTERHYAPWVRELQTHLDEALEKVNFSPSVST